MRLLDALEILKQPVFPEAPRLQIFLATGFTPLHFQTFLAAHLRRLRPDHRVQVQTGLFGDLAGNLERIQSRSCDGVAVLIEWEDLDQRLGLRTLGGWRAQDSADVVQSAANALARIQQALFQLSCPVCVCLPTLALPPLFTTVTSQASNFELQLRSSIASFAASVAERPLVRLLSSQQLDERSPVNARLDLKSALGSGFPYQLSHASNIAELLAALIHSPLPKKGLITDLDNTLWAGILGEVGVEGISWDLDQHSHIHGLYQQFLASLASAGVLIGIASKNDPALVQQALERKDLVIRKEQIYPLEAHWSPKSESVQRILKTWNIGPETVVFVDDSPMEIAEVQSAFPGIEGVLFNSNDHDAFWKLLTHLRDRFGKAAVSEEDSLRLQSIRAAGALRDSAETNSHNPAALDDFLRTAAATIHLSFDKQSRDARAFELINKTNQFNLNGKRLTETAWNEYLNEPATFLLTVSYEDKFGPLGKIAALLGRFQDKVLHVDFWVMSCRAFSRRIEHQCLRLLFERFEVQEIQFDYCLTPRNGPLQEFFGTLLRKSPAPDFRLSVDDFSRNAPPLFHRVNRQEAVHA